MFLAPRHDRRQVVHFNVTASPTARRAARQIVEAFPFDGAPRFLLWDRDGIYGHDFSDRIEHITSTDLRSPHRASLPGYRNWRRHVNGRLHQRLRV